MLSGHVIYVPLASPEQEGYETCVGYLEFVVRRHAPSRRFTKVGICVCTEGDRTVTSAQSVYGPLRYSGGRGVDVKQSGSSVWDMRYMDSTVSSLAFLLDFRTVAGEGHEMESHAV